MSTLTFIFLILVGSLNSHYGHTQLGTVTNPTHYVQPADGSLGEGIGG